MSATQPSSLGKYEIRGMLGKGAMGTVYDGWDPVIDRRVAIKTVRLPDANDEEATEGLARFKREAQAAGRLSHPNIVGVFDYGETNDVAYIVMEFVEGRSLKDVLGAGERMAVPDIVALMQGVLAGLTYSHSRGVVHRDIKPANIMLTKEGQAKIADFGIARIEASSMTQAGTVMGTPAYMSPEQFMGQVVDRRTDIYSCGVMLYQLLTGDRPFDGSMTAIMHKAMTTTPPRPSELAVTAPAALDPVVAKAMARRPEDRFDSAEAFAQALRAQPAQADPFASDATIMAAPTRPATTPPPPPVPAAVPAAAGRGSKVPMIAGGAVALVVVAGALVWFLLPGPTKPTDPERQASIAPAQTAPSRAISAPVSPATPPAVPPPIVAQPQPAPSTASVAPPVPPPPATPQPSQQASVAPVPAPVPPVLPTTPPPAYNPPPQAASLAPPSSPPAPSPPAPAAPAPAQLASISTPSPSPHSAASVEAALAASLPGIKCSLARLATTQGGALSLQGVGGKGQPEEELHRAAAAADPAGLGVDIQSFDGPYCPALDLLRPVAEAVTQNRNGMDLVQSGGAVSLHDNDVIALQVTMPGFAGYLHVAYLQHDATVSPQVPGPGYPAQTYAARARIDLGKPRADFEGWHVGPPFGTDMIVAIASTAPLFSRALPDSQPLASYLSALQTAIEALRRRGGSVAAAALVLDTRPAS
jgi:serine/threonine-protein kinase